MLAGVSEVSRNEIQSHVDNVRCQGYKQGWGVPWRFIVKDSVDALLGCVRAWVGGWVGVWVRMLSLSPEEPR